MSLDHGAIDFDPDTSYDKQHRLGRDIAFGLQQTAACFSTDFIDPPVSKFLQNKFGNSAHEVTDKHVWGGEIAGDSTALFLFLGIKKYLARPVDAIISNVRRGMNGRLESMGHYALQPWAQKHHVDENSERYRRKLEQYKDFQAENIVDSTIVATSATASNVLYQHYVFKNAQALPVILGSKIVGAIATMTVMLGLRAAIPTTTKQLDSELNDRVFSPILRSTQQLFGVSPHDVKPAADADAPAPAAEPTLVSLSDAPAVQKPLPESRRSELLEYLRRAYAERDPSDADAFATFREKQKQRIAAFIAVLSPRGDYAKALAEAHYQALETLEGHAKAQFGLPDEVLKKSAEVAVQSILLNRRDDMLASAKLLNDPAFLHELRARLSQPAQAKSQAPQLAIRKQEALIESLLQTRGDSGREPAVHIYATAKGQAREHQALAQAFDAHAEPAKVLEAELAKRMPLFTRNDVAAIARDYTEDRRHAALLVTHALRLDGPLVNTAVSRSEALRTSFAGRETLRRVDTLSPVKLTIA